LGGQG
jgi:hypothetical protein